MRHLIFMLLASCATIHEPVGEKPQVVTYWGTAKGATDIVDAQRSFDLTQSAMDKGWPVSLHKTDEFVGFNAGNSYVAGSGSWGYAPADVVSTMGGWYAPTGMGSSLPRLGTTVVANVHQDASDKIVPCPTDHKRSNVAEQAACAEVVATIALSRTKGK